MECTSFLIIIKAENRRFTSSSRCVKSLFPGFRQAYGNRIIIPDPFSKSKGEKALFEKGSLRYKALRARCFLSTRPGVFFPPVFSCGQRRILRKGKRGAGPRPLLFQDGKRKNRFPAQKKNGIITAKLSPFPFPYNLCTVFSAKKGAPPDSLSVKL